MTKLTYRKAKLYDLSAIIDLLINDKLGSARETLDGASQKKYMNAFHLIDSDPNQYLMVVESNNEIIGTCHLTIMPSMTFTGSTRMQIEAVRISEKMRGQKIGEWMINEAIEYGKSKDASIIQLSTNKERSEAMSFYLNLGFQDTHIGMKKYIINIS